MIIGHGIDLIDIRRIDRTIDRFGERFIKRIFTKNERIRSDKKQKRIESYAKRFAAKEACSKALGAGFRLGVYWKNIEVVNEKSGKPSLKLTGGAYERLKKLEEYLILPEKEKNSDPSWFGFPLTIRDINKFDRTKLMQYLNENNIGTRLLFGGNVIKQPYMKDVKYRVGSNLENTEIVMSNTFWIGLFPGLTNKHLEHSSEKIISFFKNK